MNPPLGSIVQLQRDLDTDRGMNYVQCNLRRCMVPDLSTPDCRLHAIRCWSIAGLFCLCSTALHATSPGRNILFIVVDDLRTWVNYTSDYPGAVHTPNIDALAAISTRYLNAYATVPQCAPSRMSVMLGLSPATHGLTRPSFGVGDPVYDRTYNNPDLKSLPEVLRDAGYHTVATGKVFNNLKPERWRESGPPHTDSKSHGGFDPGPDQTYLHPSISHEGERHPDQIVADWSSTFLTSYSRPEPFFLAVGFYLPHIPWHVPQWAYDLYPLGQVIAHRPVARDLDDEPPEAVSLAAEPRVGLGRSQHEAIELSGKAAVYTQAYLAAISHTDAMVGQVLRALAASPHAGDTDIIFWSDHGFHLGEKFHWRKNTLWEQSIKVPLLICAPAHPGYAARDVADPVSLLDLSPTVLDLAGEPPFAQFEGKPLQAADASRPVTVYFRSGQARIFRGWKFIDYDTRAPPTPQDVALYWLPGDPGETTNLLAPLAKATRLSNCIALKGCKGLRPPQPSHRFRGRAEG